jgi:hypothetical protein
MTPMPILGMLCSACHEPSDQSLEEVLCEAPECFKGFLGTSEGHMSYIFHPEDSTVKIFTDRGPKPLYPAKPGSFPPALGMREWLNIRLALCKIEQVLSVTNVPGYALEEQVCGRSDLKALRIASMDYSPDNKVTILACDLYDKANATKSVNSPVASRARKHVNFFIPVFSFKWVDYPIFITLMNKLDILFQNGEQLKRWARLSLRQSQDQKARRRIYPWSENLPSVDGHSKRALPFEGELDTDNGGWLHKLPGSVRKAS